MSDSLITKKAIVEGMKELTKKKAFDKITVSDIAEICGLNRQTFYYHFQDKYDLVNWIYYNEIIAAVVDGLTYENCMEKVLQMLNKMKADDYFYISTLKASVKNEFEESLFKVVRELFCDIISEIVEDFHATMEEDEIRFIADFYSFGMTGMIISWASNGMKKSPEVISKQIKSLYLSTEKFVTTHSNEIHNQF
jgi:probable dihydroxyacetone kinase regulator